MNAIAIKKFAFDYILLQDNLEKDDKILLGTYVSEGDQYQVMHLLLFGSMVPPMTEDMNADVEEVFNVLTEDWPVDASVKAGEYLEKGADVGKFVATKAIEKAIDPRKGISALQRLAASWASYKVPPGGFSIGGFKIGIPKMWNKEWQTNYAEASVALHAGAALSAIAVTIMIFMAAKKAYKATMSKAARSCKQYEGNQKDECIRNFHVEAIKKDIEVMQKNRKSCEVARKPGKCITKVDNRIKKQKDKLQKALTTKKPKNI